MTTPSPSPPISLSPPSAGERLARCTAPPAHSSPPPVPSPLLPSSGCPTQIQTLRITSTQALIDAVTAALPSPPLPPLPPSLYIPPPVDYTRSGRVLLLDLPEVLGLDPSQRQLRDRTYDVGEVNTRVTELAELHELCYIGTCTALRNDAQGRYGLVIFTSVDIVLAREIDLLMGDMMTLQETIWLVEEEAYAFRKLGLHSIGLSQETLRKPSDHRDHVYAHETHLQAHQTQLQLQGTLIQTQHQAQMVETLRVIRDMSDMQAELLALRGQLGNQDQMLGVHITRMLMGMLTVTSSDACYFILLGIHPSNDRPGFFAKLHNEDGSHSSYGDNRRNVQTARPCFYADFMKCQPLNFKGTEGVVGLTQWIEKMESVFNISGCAIENQVKFALTLDRCCFGIGECKIETLGPEAYAMTWEVLKKKMTDKYCPQGEIKKLEIEL
ncbi:hypothetical protein Tco_1197980 [Tanacetum coccineum]